jgi:glycosyltransferase involved in cell wall biosynthesis
VKQVASRYAGLSRVRGGRASRRRGDLRRPVRVLVDARFVPGASGATETLALGLAQGLAELDAPDLEVDFLTYTGFDDWLWPYTGGSVRRTGVRVASADDGHRRRSPIWELRFAAGSLDAVPGPDPVLDELRADVVHFPFQNGYRVRAPSVYQPHDLQHRHVPEFFDRRAIPRREVTYRYLGRRAATVAVGASWVKQELVTQYGVPPEKVSVIPLAALDRPADPPSSLGVDLGRLPERFVVYPAVPWRYKNHAGLVEAVALLRERGVDVPVVLTGGGGEHRAVLGELAARHGVADRVTDLGYLSRADLDAVVRRATAMVVPTLFEAASFPVWEAFRAGTPVACSNVTSLPRQVGEAGLVFDPHSAASIADAVERLWTDPPLRERLSGLGRSRVRRFTWCETARRFAAVYRRAAGAELTDEDRHLLEEKPAI